MSTSLIRHAFWYHFPKDDTPLRTIAHEMDLFWTVRNDNNSGFTYANNLEAIWNNSSDADYKPNAPSIQYVISNYVKDYDSMSSFTDGRADSYGNTGSWAQDITGDMLLYDINGAALWDAGNRPGGKKYYIDPASPSLRTYFKTRSRFFLESSGLNGIGFDNIELAWGKPREAAEQQSGNPRFFRRVNGALVEYTSSAQFKSAYVALMQTIRDYLDANGLASKQLWGNMIDANGTEPDSWNDYFSAANGPLTGGLFETWINGYPNTPELPEWKQQNFLDQAQWLVDNGKPFICVGQATNTDWYSTTNRRRMRHGLCAYLLIVPATNTNPAKAMYRFTHTGSTNYPTWVPYDEYNSNLGAPDGAYERTTVWTGNAGWRRTFNGGTNIVEVCPITRDGKITIGATPPPPATTFGRTTDGNASRDLTEGMQRVSRFTLDQSASVSKLTARLTGLGAGVGASQLIKGTIYRNGANNLPTDLLGTTNQATVNDNAAASWIDLPFASSVALTPGDYWLGIHAGASGDVAQIREQSASVPDPPTYRWNTNYSSGPANPAPSAPSSSGYQIAVYATFASETAPAAPSALTVTPGTTSNALAWTDNSSNETAFVVQVSSDNVSWSTLATVGANVTSYTHSGLGSEVTRYYRVRARNNAGESAASNVARGTTGTYATFGVETAGTLNWTINGGRVRVYVPTTPFSIAQSGKLTRMRVNVEGDATNAQVARLVIYDDSSGAAGAFRAVSKEFNVAALQAAGWVWVDVDPVVSLPAGSYHLGIWTGATDASLKLKYASETGGPFKNQASAYSSTGTPINPYGTPTGTNDVKPSIYAEYAYTVGTAPAAPSGLAASSITTSSITWTWADNSSNETAMAFEYSLDQSSWTVVSLAANTTSYTTSGLAPRTRVYARVKATNGTGSSAYTPIVNAETIAVVAPDPSVPSLGMAEYKVIVRDRLGIKKAELTDFLELEYTRQVNAPGLARIVLDGEHAAIPHLAHNGQIEIWRRNVSQGLAWYQDFVGLFRGHEWQHTGGVEQYVALCPGLLSMLSWRVIAYPAETNGQTTFQDAAETIMKALVTNNIGANANDSRRARSGLLRAGTITVEQDNAGRGRPGEEQGPTLSWSGAYQNLLSALQEIAAVAGDDFDLIKTGAATWEFRYYVGQRGTDRSGTQIFALSYGNIANPRLRYDRTSERSDIIVGGRGEKEGRLIGISTSSSLTAEEDSEYFQSDTNRNTLTGVLDKARALAQEKRARRELDFEVLQTPTSYYGKHYTFGDLVTSMYREVTVVQQIAEATIRVAAQGEQVRIRMRGV